LATVIGLQPGGGASMAVASGASKPFFAPTYQAPENREETEGVGKIQDWEHQTSNVCS